MPLDYLSDMQLIKQFAVSVAGELSEQGKVILMELLARGYVYDVRQEQFLTANQWKERYGDVSPTVYFADLYENLRQRRKLGHRAS
jgi:hypothetical protein